MLLVALVCAVVACTCFALSAWGTAPGRVNLIAVGLLFTVVAGMARFWRGV